VAVRFSRSAARHGIAHERSRFVVEHCQSPLYPVDDDETSSVIFLGPDARGVPLEVIGLELADGDLLVIHAMPLRRRFREEYERMMQWREQ
jgi:hypothetical protein